MNAEGMVKYGDTGPAVASFGHVRITKLAFPAVLDALRESIKSDGLWVLHEIDPQAILSRAGLVIGVARQILFFHPKLMVRLLQADPAALLEAPLKFAVMELADGTVSVRWFDPAVAFARYGNPALAALGQELAATCERIAAAALGNQTEQPG